MTNETNVFSFENLGKITPFGGQPLAINSLVRPSDVGHSLWELWHGGFEMSTVCPGNVRPNSAVTRRTECWPGKESFSWTMKPLGRSRLFTGGWTSPKSTLA